MNPKLVFLAIDGLNGCYVGEKLKSSEAWLGFRKLAEIGEIIVLRSLDPPPGFSVPLSGPCWASIYSGVSPSKHGVTHGGWQHGEDLFTNSLLAKLVRSLDVI